MSSRLLLNPLLGLEVIEWNVSFAYEFATGPLVRFRAPATTPPCRFMTLMIPGLPFHLPVLEPSRTYSEFITVGDVLNWIHHSLNDARLSDMEYDTMFGRQREMTRYSCSIREEVAGDIQSDEFFRDSIRRIDLLAGRLHFGGIQHQYDANGANVWVVTLAKTRCTASVPYLHRLLEPGNITWDFRDAPPAINHTQMLEVVGNHMAVVDTSGHPVISIPASDSPTDTGALSVPAVLHAIYAVMNINLGNNKWPLWDSDAAAVQKHIFRNATAGQKDNILVHLNILPVDQQRFLGLWHDIYPNGHQYTLLTQPSVRPIPEIHHMLAQGVLAWKISANPTRELKGAWMNEPATFPARSAMDITIEFMSGVSWTLSVSKSHDTEFVTVCHLLSNIYKLLIQDKLEISFNKLPLHLRHAALRRGISRAQALPATAPLRKESSGFETNTEGKLEAPVAPPTAEPPKERPKAEQAKVAKKIEIYKNKKTPRSRKERPYRVPSKEDVRRRQRRKQKTPPQGFKHFDLLEATMCVGIEHLISSLGEDEWRVCLTA